MTDRKLRWGILGTARINRSFIPALRLSRRSELIAVASRDALRAEEFAQEWKIPTVMGSYEALLADPQIDVVYIPLPNGLHAEWTIKAVEAGKHVLCEKPLATRVESVDEVQAAAQKAGKVVAEAFMYRHHPQTLMAKEIVEKGRLGDLQFLRGSFSFFLNRPGDVRLIDDLWGGSIWDVGCYPINFIRYLAGCEPEEVFGWQVEGTTGVDMLFAGQMRFARGILAQMDSGFRSPLRREVEVTGTEGSLLIQEPFKPGHKEVLLLRRGNDVEEIRVRGDDLYLGEVKDMEDAVLKGTPPRISLADSRGNVATILALIESANTGRPVQLRQAIN